MEGEFREGIEQTLARKVEVCDTRMPRCKLGVQLQDLGVALVKQPLGTVRALHDNHVESHPVSGLGFPHFLVPGDGHGSDADGSPRRPRSSGWRCWRRWRHKGRVHCLYVLHVLSLGLISAEALAGAPRVEFHASSWIQRARPLAIAVSLGRLLVEPVHLGFLVQGQLRHHARPHVAHGRCKLVCNLIFAGLSLRRHGSVDAPAPAPPATHGGS
mmetsp:Transcript_13693/g.39979  ORF Transcript_13693/g.39979 Transcript_13693/m.39979 type:complete len:214 (+) Transcript_13693:574-1215(+)